MSLETFSCPHCGSNETKYNAVKSYWRCLSDTCELTFEGSPPAQPLSVSASAFKEKVFISYGHDDNTELVKALKARLEQAKHKVWIDYEQIDPAKDWRQQIVKGIIESDRILSFLSRHSVRDPGVCLDEIGIALSDRHGAIATLLVEPEHEVQAPASVAHIQYCNLSNWKAVRAQGEGAWQAWLDQQTHLILDIIARESGFAGEMDTLRQKLNPLAQHQLLGSLVKQPFVGRTWVFDALEKWRTAQLHQRLFLISGGPGMGKSMISAYLAHYSKLHAAAYHFCRWDSEESRSPHAFVCNLAYQLSARNANYRSRLIWKIEELTARKPLSEWPPNDLFTQLICEAGAGAIDGGQSIDRMLVVIDALDEAPEIARLIATRFSKKEDQPPAWIGMVVTTRPEQQIPESLSSYACQFPMLGDDQNNLADLATYIDAWSAQRSTPIALETKTTLITRSEGSIYYLHLACEGDLAGSFDLNQPENFPQGLNSWYAEWFNRQFAFQPEQWNRAKPFLRILCACPEPLPLTVASNVLGWRNEDDEAFLSPFGALIQWDNQQIQLAHRSFAEWLINTTGPYRINPAEGRIQLATYLWNYLPKLLKAKTPEFGHMVLPKLILETASERRTDIWGEDGQHLARIDELTSTLENFQILKIRLARLTLAELAMQSSEVQFGPESPETLDAKSEWAYLLREVASEFMRSHALLAEVVAVREKTLGEEHPATLSAMLDLANTMYAQSDYAGARTLQEKALAARERILGPEHPDTLRAMNNLAVALSEQGDLSGARGLHEKVLTARERILGPEHPDTFSTIHNLATTLSDQGDHAGARALREKVLAVHKRVLGSEHPDTLSAIHNLAISLSDQGDLAGARALQEKVLVSQEGILGPEHQDTLSTMHNLANTLRRQADLVGARTLQDKVLKARERILGPEHQDTLSAMSNLAVTLSNQDDLVSARALQEKVLATRKRILGPEHLDTLSAMHNLADTLGVQGDRAGAKNLQEKVLAARERILGPEHPDTLSTMNSLIITLALQGDLAGAKALHEKVLAAA